MPVAGCTNNHSTSGSDESTAPGGVKEHINRAGQPAYMLKHAAASLLLPHSALSKKIARLSITLNTFVVASLKDITCPVQC
jgi:hypothetical protein